MIQDKLKIIANDKIAPEYYKMLLRSPQIIKSAQPGQFVHIKISPDVEPLLRRPFSLHAIKDDATIEILYRVVGRGTSLLSKKKQGEELDVIGPLGNGFRLSPNDEKIVIIGGGAGSAPLFFLTQKLINYSNQIKVLIGGKTKEVILCEEEFKDLGVEVQIATEDGSYGHKGLVTDLLTSLPTTSSSVFACGPAIMLREVANFSLKNKLSCQISLEAIMACGLGACLGCVIKIKDRDTILYKRVCKDGPVFKASEVIW